MMKAHLRLNVSLGCLLALLALLAVPFLTTARGGNTEPAGPPVPATEKPAETPEAAEAEPVKKVPDEDRPDKKAAEKPVEKPAEKPVEKLDPQRAALGPVQIDRMPAPVVPPNKRYARLPAYYSQVVSEKQRQRIYAIQRLFGPKLDEYKLKYEALKDQRDEKIEQVLTAEQRAQIEQFKLAAKAKRAGKQ